MKIVIIVVLMVCSYLATKGQGVSPELIGIYKSTVSRACIVLYKTNNRYRAKAYKDFAVARKYVYTGSGLARIPEDKAHLDFIVDYSEPAFENLHNKDDVVAFTLPRKNDSNQAVLEFFAKAGTKFKPL